MKSFQLVDNIYLTRMFGHFQIPLKQFMELQRFKNSIIKLTDSERMDFRTLSTSLIRYDIAIDEIYSVCSQSGAGMNALVFIINEHQQESKSWKNLKFFKEYKNQIQ